MPYNVRNYSVRRALLRHRAVIVGHAALLHPERVQNV
jgi:hypothetical protein